MSSTVDPDARHAHKSWQKKVDGFKFHIVIEPDTGLVTSAVLTKAAGAGNSDAARGGQLIIADTSIGDVLGGKGSAYGSGELLAAITNAGHTPIIKPRRLGRAILGGFTVDKFTIDENGNTATYPAGTTGLISANGRVSFGGGCASCSLMGQCTTAKNGRKMHILPHDPLRREHRCTIRLLTTLVRGSASHMTCPIQVAIQP